MGVGASETEDVTSLIKVRNIRFNAGSPKGQQVVAFIYCAWNKLGRIALPKILCECEYDQSSLISEFRRH